MPLTVAPRPSSSNRKTPTSFSAWLRSATTIPTKRKKAIYYYHHRVMALSEINPATRDSEKTTTIPLAVAAYHRIQAIKEEMHFVGKNYKDDQ